MVYAPEGFAHGYQTLADDTEMCYMTSAPMRRCGRGCSLRRPGLANPVADAGDVFRMSIAAWPDFRREMSMKRCS